MEDAMDRRQRRTREAIFEAFTDLLSKKDFDRITVSEIIDKADVGRATFYAHFETKDDLLKALSDELFCHIADAMDGQHPDHRHIFNCDAPPCVFLHLFRHLQKNDHNILRLLSGQNNDLFFRCFKSNFAHLADSQFSRFAARKSDRLPDDFWRDHIAATFVETVRWWVAHGMKESAETITDYFFLSV